MDLLPRADSAIVSCLSTLARINVAKATSVMAALGLAASVGQLVDYAFQIVTERSKLCTMLDGAPAVHPHNAVAIGMLYVATSMLDVYLANCKCSDQALSLEKAAENRR